MQEGLRRQRVIVEAEDEGGLLVDRPVARGALQRLVEAPRHGVTRTRDVDPVAIDVRAEGEGGFQLGRVAGGIARRDRINALASQRRHVGSIEVGLVVRAVGDLIGVGADAGAAGGARSCTGAGLGRGGGGAGHGNAGGDAGTGGRIDFRIGFRHIRAGDGEPVGLGGAVDVDGQHHGMRRRGDGGAGDQRGRGRPGDGGGLEGVERAVEHGEAGTLGNAGLVREKAGEVLMADIGAAADERGDQCGADNSEPAISI